MNTEEIIQKLETGVKEVFESEKYKNYLNVMSKFHNYSSANSLLIMMQRPDASHVAGFQTWNKVFGRTVNRGEKAINIIAPRTHKENIQVNVVDDRTGRQVYKSGKPVTESKEVKRLYFTNVSVFDVSQTSGKPLPTLTEELKGSVKQFDKFMGAIKDLSPVPVVFEDIKTGSKGYYDGSKLAIKDGMSEIQTLKTGIHELSHSRLHSKDEMNEVSKDRLTKEVEAESVAYTVCNRFGIDTGDYSFPCIAGWSSDKSVAELRESLETIQREANHIICHIEKALGISLENQQAPAAMSQEDISKSFTEIGKRIEAGSATPEEISRFNEIQEQRLNRTVETIQREAQPVAESDLVR